MTMGTHRHHTAGSASQRQQQLATGRFYQRVLTLIIWLLVLVLLAAAGLFLVVGINLIRFGMDLRAGGEVSPTLELRGKGCTRPCVWHRAWLRLSRLARRVSGECCSARQ
jgi:hypothetical protein